MKCKKCGSNRISIERRIDGNCNCLDCGNVWKNILVHKVTNGDRIRTMSDDELSLFFVELAFGLAAESIKTDKHELIGKYNKYFKTEIK